MTRRMSSRWPRQRRLVALLCALAATLSLVLSACATVSIPSGLTPSPQSNNPCVSYGDVAPPFLARVLNPIFPVAADDVVYVGYPIPTTRAGVVRYTYDIAAFRASDGAMLWSIPDTNATSWLTFVDGKLILLGRNMVALRPADGQALWQEPLGIATTREMPLAVHGGVLYASGGADIYAVRLADGRMLWQTPAVENTSLSAPVLDGNSLYVGSSDGAIMALRADTGAIRWRVFIDPTHPRIYTTVAMLDGRLLVSAPGVSLFVNPANGVTDGAASPPIAASSIVDLLAVDGSAYVGVVGVTSGNTPTTPSTGAYSLLTSDGRLLWRVSTGAWSERMVAYDASTLYLGYGKLYAVRLSDGVVLWSQQPSQTFLPKGFAAAPGYLFETASGLTDPCNPKIDQSPEIRALSSADGSVIWTVSFDPALEPPPCATCRSS